MTARIFHFLCCVFVAGLIGSCRSIVTPDPTDTTDYFPLETGRYVVYDVSERRYSLTATPVSRTYQLKEVIGLPYTDVANQLAYRLLRYIRTTDSEPWQLDSIWSARRTTTEAVRTENGRDVVKVMFPVVDKVRWNANRLNALGADAYELRNVGRPFSVLGVPFSETALVEQQADSTLVGQDKRREVYARRVGLIYKEIIQVQFCTASPGCLGNQQIDYGLQQTYQIRRYGRE